MVVSAAVPAVVGSATMGTLLCRVGAQPSSDTMSENSGLLITMPIPLAVSIADPPPMAIMKSASAFLYTALHSGEWYHLLSGYLYVAHSGVGLYLAEYLIFYAGFVEYVGDHFCHTEFDESRVGDNESLGLAQAVDYFG